MNPMTLQWIASFLGLLEQHAQARQAGATVADANVATIVSALAIIQHFESKPSLSTADLATTQAGA